MSNLGSLAGREWGEDHVAYFGPNLNEAMRMAEEFGLFVIHSASPFTRDEPPVREGYWTDSDGFIRAWERLVYSPTPAGVEWEHRP